MTAFVLGLAGAPSSGKTSVARSIASSFGAPRISFGDLVRHEAELRGLPPERETWQELGSRLVAELGAEGMIGRALDLAGLEPTDVPAVWDGVRHAEVDDALRTLYAPVPVLLVVLQPPDQARQARVLAEAGTQERMERWERHETESHLDELASRAQLVCRASRLSDAVFEVEQLVGRYAVDT